VQEEFRQNTRDGSSSKCDDEEDFSLTAKARKGKGKKFHPKSESKVKKLDLSKVKCFHCHEHGHLTTNYPQMRKNKKVVEAATGEALASQFDLEFSLIACMESSASGSVWYLDSGASFHMTGDRESFSDLEEKDLRMHIEMGDDGRYSANGIGTITDPGDQILLKIQSALNCFKSNGCVGLIITNPTQLEWVQMDVR
jgi:hypothetical protein